jgi:hypothetical protein
VKIVKQAVTEIRTVNINCPTDDQIKDIAIAASRATYFKAPRIYRSGSGDCPCRHDTYEQNGKKLPCNEKSAEAKKHWVICDREDVPKTLVEELKVKMSACQTVVR